MNINIKKPLVQLNQRFDCIGKGRGKSKVETRSSSKANKAKGKGRSGRSFRNRISKDKENQNQIDDNNDNDDNDANTDANAIDGDTRSLLQDQQNRGGPCKMASPLTPLIPLARTYLNRETTRRVLPPIRMPMILISIRIQIWNRINRLLSTLILILFQ